MSFFFFFGRAACGIPDQGLNLCPLHWEHRVLTTGSPGKSHQCLLKNQIQPYWAHLSTWQQRAEVEWKRRLGSTPQVPPPYSVSGGLALVAAAPLPLSQWPCFPCQRGDRLHQRKNCREFQHHLHLLRCPPTLPSQLILGMSPCPLVAWIPPFFLPNP